MHNFVNYLSYYLFGVHGNQLQAHSLPLVQSSSKIALSSKGDGIMDRKPVAFVSIIQTHPSFNPQPITHLFNVSHYYRNGNITTLLAEMPHSLQKNDRRLKGLIFQKFIRGFRTKWSVYEESTIKDLDRFTITLVVVST